MLCAVAGLLVPPVAFVAARQLDRVTIVQATGATGASALLGLFAILLARRAFRNIERSIGRVGGEATARVGRLLGVLSLCIGLTAGLALGFYALLNFFG